MNRDIESNYALNLLLSELDGHTTRVVVSDRVGGKGVPGELLALRAVEQEVPNELLFPIVECRVPSAERALTFSELARYCGGEPPTALDVNSDAGAKLLRTFAPELIITIRYGHILRAGAIGVPAYGVVNLHSGILPRYRGILSTLHAMAQGDDEVGCTLHWIVDAGIDTGPIIAVARRPVERGHSLLWHVLSLYPLGVPLILETVRRLTMAEDVPHTVQSPDAGVYRSHPTAADVQALRARGFELFDVNDLRDMVARYAPIAVAPHLTEYSGL